MSGVPVARVQSSDSRVQSFRDLIVWQKSMDLVTVIYQLTKSFTKDELYSLTQQLKRCAISVPSNIAEGSSKRSTREYIRFLNISYSSLCELETQCEIALRLDYVGEEQLHDIDNYTKEIGKMLNSLMNRLEQKL